MDYSLPGSSVHGIFQARILGAEVGGGLPFSMKRDIPNPGTEPVSPVSPALTGRFFTEPPGKLTFQCTARKISLEAWK